MFKRTAIFPSREIAPTVQRISSFTRNRLKSVFGGLEGGLVWPPDSVPTFVPSLTFGHAVRVEWPCGERSRDDDTVRMCVIFAGAEPNGFHLPEIRSQLVFYCE